MQDNAGPANAGAMQEGQGDAAKGVRPRREGAGVWKQRRPLEPARWRARPRRGAGAAGRTAARAGGGGGPPRQVVEQKGVVVETGPGGRR